MNSMLLQTALWLFAAMLLILMIGRRRRRKLVR